MILLHAFKAERALIHFVYCGKIDSLDKSTFQVLCHRHFIATVVKIQKLNQI
jgi:hypothetical protein